MRLLLTRFDKDTSLRVNLNLDGTPITSRTHTHTSHVLSPPDTWWSQSVPKRVIFSVNICEHLYNKHEVIHIFPLTVRYV